MTPQELKNSILQLAIQGKLVKQRPEEGTAQELYAQIQAEKQRLIKEGKIKKEKPLPEITEEEKPFEIPEGWMWVRLGDYCEKVTDQVASGSFASLRENVPSLKEPNYALMVKTADFSNNFSRNLTYTTQHGYEFLSNSNLFGGELILSNIGSIGKCFIVPKLNIPMTLAPNAVMIRLVFEGLRNYLYFFILSHQGLLELMEITSGTAMKKFNKTDLKKILVPIPPLNEQKRIVAKIEELLPLVDRYEQAWTKLEDFNRRFPEDMKKSILQQAIQGKLVEQRPEEGTAQELYAQIQAEKRRLIKEGKIKKEKPLPEIAEEEKPFEIPEGWMWVRLGEICKSISDGDHQPPPQVPEGVPFLVISNVSASRIDFSSTRYVPQDYFNALSNDRTAQKGDILFTVTGSYGIPIKVESDEKFCFQRHIALLKLMLDWDYIFYILKSPTIKSQCDAVATGTAQKTVGLKALRNLLIPLPPPAEQKRIVERLEELLAMCERLKQK